MAALRVMDELASPSQLFDSPTVTRWTVLVSGTALGLYLLWRHVWMLDAAETLHRKQKRLLCTQQRAASSTADFSDPAILSCLYDTLTQPSSHPLCALDWSFPVRHGTSITPIGEFEISTEDGLVAQWIKSRGVSVKYICQPTGSVPGELQLLSANIVQVAVSRGWVGQSAVKLGCVSVSKRVGEQIVTVSARNVQLLDRFFTCEKPSFPLKIGFCNDVLMSKMQSEHIAGVGVREETTTNLKTAGDHFANLRHKWEIDLRTDIVTSRYSLALPWLPDIFPVLCTYLARLLFALHICDVREQSFPQAYSQWRSVLCRFLNDCGSLGAVCAHTDWTSCGTHIAEAGLTLVQFAHPSTGTVTAIGREAACLFLLKTFATECI